MLLVVTALWKLVLPIFNSSSSLSVNLSSLTSPLLTGSSRKLTDIQECPGRALLPSMLGALRQSSPVALLGTIRNSKNISWILGFCPDSVPQGDSLLWFLDPFYWKQSSHNCSPLSLRQRWIFSHFLARPLYLKGFEPSARSWESSSRLELWQETKQRQ